MGGVHRSGHGLSKDSGIWAMLVLGVVIAAAICVVAWYLIQKNEAAQPEAHLFTLPAPASAPRAQEQPRMPRDAAPAVPGSTAR